MPADSLESRLKAAAIELGFAAAGLFQVHESPAGAHTADWIARGQHGSMQWIERHVPAKGDPRAYWPQARSGIVVAMPYFHPTPAATDPLLGRISRYAWGRDYHKVVRKRLDQLLLRVQALIPGATGKVCVDTSPLAEKDLAQRAGLGWIGKHGNLIRRGLGSWFFLGVILLDVDLTPDAPASAHCGTCTRCIEACPTAAIVAPGQVDANRCISYLTIEHRDAIPEPLRAPMGNLVYGCDICQDVCPHNRFASPTPEADFAPRHGLDSPSLVELLQQDEAAFLQRFAGSPIMRTKRRGLARNVAIALGNAADPQTVPALSQALQDPDPEVRRHAAWALAQIANDDARRALSVGLSAETDDSVQADLRALLGD